MQKLLGCFGTMALVVIIAAVIVAFLPDDDTATCAPAPDGIVADIANGLNDDAALTDAVMVRAEDRVNVTFVAARVDGEIGVWATSRIDAEGNYTDTGLIYSVGDVANDVSNWGDGGRTDAALEITEDAAQQAVSCVDSD